MTTDLEQKLINQIEEQLTTTSDLFLVKLKIDEKNNIQVFLDGDNGIAIGQCTSINRFLYNYIEENELISNNDFSLEVSSAGIDEPLILERQYVKNIGRNVEVELIDGNKLIGKLIAVTNEKISLEITNGKGKKLEISTEIFDLAKIKSIIVQIKF